MADVQTVPFGNELAEAVYLFLDRGSQKWTFLLEVIECARSIRRFQMSRRLPVSECPATKL
jgi:hypothetical protein